MSEQEQTSVEVDASVEDSATTQNNSAPTQSESTVTSEQLEAYKAKVDELQNRNDGLSRKLGSIEVQLKKLATQPATQEPSKQKETGITAEMKELEAFKAELQNEKVLNSLESSLSKAGVVGSPEKLARLISMDLGDTVRVEGRSVVVDDGSETVPVLDFINAYVKTDEGKWMMPQRTASSQSLAGEAQAASKQKVTMEDLNRMSPEELRNGSFEVID